MNTNKSKEEQTNLVVLVVCHLHYLSQQALYCFLLCLKVRKRQYFIVDGCVSGCVVIVAVGSCGYCVCVVWGGGAARYVVVA